MISVQDKSAMNCNQHLVMKLMTILSSLYCLSSPVLATVVEEIPLLYIKMIKQALIRIYSQ